MLPKLPLGFLVASEDSAFSLPGDVPAVGDSAPLSKLRERFHLSFVDFGESGMPLPTAPRRKICTVSVVEETQSRVELKLKDMLYIVDGYVPLRNWYSFVPFGRENTLIIVPVSEAVASKVPSLFKAMQDNGARWASTTFNALSSTASKIKTDPDVGAT